MAPLRTRLYLALDKAAVCAATIGEGLTGRRAQSFVRVALPPGSLTPSPSGPNVVLADEVRAAVRRSVEGAEARRVTLVLPDGVARLALLDVPPKAEPREYARFRLASSLPWPASEASVDGLAAGRGRLVAAAVRRATVAEYEHAAAAAGLEIEHVHLAPLVALAGLMRAGGGEAVHVVLGDVALLIAAFHEGLPTGLRSRRRDRSAGEAGRLLEEARRTAVGSGNGATSPPLVLSGADSSRLRLELGLESGAPGLAGPGEWPGATEAAWLGGLVS